MDTQTTECGLVADAYRQRRPDADAANSPGGGQTIVPVGEAAPPPLRVGVDWTSAPRRTTVRETTDED